MVSEEFEPEINEETWMLMQRLHWAWMADYTGQEMQTLTDAFEKWCNSKSAEELDDILGVEETPQDEANVPLHSAEDIMKSMWNGSAGEE